MKAIQPVPGNNTLAANLMAGAWNSSSELQTVTIGAARSVARKWAQNLLLGTWEYLCLDITLSDLSHMGRKNNSSHQIKSIYHIIIYMTTI